MLPNVNIKFNLKNESEKTNALDMIFLYILLLEHYNSAIDYSLNQDQFYPKHQNRKSNACVVNTTILVIDTQILEFK